MFRVDMIVVVAVLATATGGAAIERLHLFPANAEYVYSGTVELCVGWHRVCVGGFVCGLCWGVWGFEGLFVLVWRWRG